MIRRDSMIFKGSRFVGNNLFVDTDNDMTYLDQPSTYIKPHKSDLIYRFVAGDRLDLLAKRFYGDSQKHWIILYANPQYSNETEIEEGALLTIPAPERMM